MFKSPAGTSPATGSKIDWKIYLKSIYNFDTGKVWLVIKHILKTPIYESDVITFGLGFTTTSDTAVKSQATKDSVRCTVQINKMDTTQWVQSVVDGYFYNDATKTPQQQYAVDTVSDWSVYDSDDDSDNPFCQWS